MRDFTSHDGAGWSPENVMGGSETKTTRASGATRISWVAWMAWDARRYGIAEPGCGPRIPMRSPARRAAVQHACPQSARKLPSSTPKPFTRSREILFSTRGSRLPVSVNANGSAPDSNGAGARATVAVVSVWKRRQHGQVSRRMGACPGVGCGQCGGTFLCREGARGILGAGRVVSGEKPRDDRSRAEG